MKDELITEVAWLMRDVAGQNLGKIDWDKIAETLVKKKYIKHLSPEKRKQIAHDFKRTSGALRGISECLDKLFVDISELIKEEK